MHKPNCHRYAKLTALTRAIDVMVNYMNTEIIGYTKTLQY